MSLIDRLKLHQKVRKKNERKLWECVDRMISNGSPSWLLMSNGITKWVGLLDLQQDYVKAKEKAVVEDDGA